jgi:hypothetical protein
VTRRASPFALLAASCIGLAPGCATDPIVGEWQMIEMRGDEMPFTSIDESDGTTRVVDRGLTVFDDLTGLITSANSLVQDLTVDFSGSDVNWSASAGENGAQRVWVRPSEELPSNYEVLFLDESPSMPCTLEVLVLLSCQEAGESEPLLYRQAEAP